MKTNNDRTEFIHFRISSIDKARLEQYCLENNCSKSFILIDIIRKLSISSGIGVKPIPEKQLFSPDEPNIIPIKPSANNKIASINRDHRHWDDDEFPGA